MYLKKCYYFFMVILMLLAASFQSLGMSYSRPPHRRMIADSDSLTSVFLRVVSTKKTVHVGEPFMVKYMLYNSVQVIDPETNVDVKFLNCYQEEFSVDTALAYPTVNGKRYTLVNLKQYLVIPNSAGLTSLPRIKIQLKMYGKPDTGFFEEEKLITKDIISDKGGVIVEKLPPNPDSALFCGAVGKFNVKGFYKQAPKIKNMLLYHLVIDGIGNTKSAAIVVPHFPEGLEVYNVNTTRHDSVTNYGIKTRFEYTFQVVANYRGKYAVPPVVFNVYDPEANKYVNFTTGTYDWQVDHGPELIKQPKTHKQTNDLYVENSLYASTNETFSYSGWYYILFFIGLALSVYSYLNPYFNKTGVVFLEFVNGKMNKYLTLKSIQKLIAESSKLEEDVFWKRLTSILYKYIKREAKMPADDISDLSFDPRFFSEKIPADLYQQVILFLSGLQSIRFNARKSPSIDKVQSCNQLITIVNALDTNWHE